MGTKMTDNEKVRKLRHDLYISGIGVILLGVWGCIRATMTLYLSKEGIDTSEIEAEYVPIYMAALLVLLLFLTIIIMAFHLYVGLNAMKAGKKGSKKKAYLFVAAFMGILSLLSFAGDYEIVHKDISQIDVAIAAFLVDVTFVFVIADIIYSSVMIGKLEKLRADKGEQ